MLTFRGTDKNSILALSFVSLIGVSALTPLMISPLFALAYTDVLGFSLDTAGYIIALTLFGIAISTLVVSLKSNTWDLTKVTYAGLGIVLLFNILLIFMQTPSAIFLLSFLGGLGSGLAQAAVAVALTRTTSHEKSFGIYIFWQFLVPGLAFAWFGGIFYPELFGDFEIVPLLFSEAGFFGQVGLSAMLVAVAIFNLIAIALTGIISRYTLKEGETGDTIELSLITKPKAMLSLIGLCLYGAANVAVWTYSFDIGLDIDGITGESTEDDFLMSSGRIGAILTIITLASVLGPVFVTMMKDKFGHYLPLVGGVGVQILAMFIMLNSDSVPSYGIGIGLFSIAWAFTWPYFLSIQGTFDSTGSVVSAGQSVNLLGNAGGPFLAAIVVGSGGDVSNAIWLAALLFVLALVPMLMIRFVRDKPAAVV